MKMEKNNLVMLVAAAFAVSACNELSVDENLAGSVAGQKISISGTVSDGISTKAPVTDKITVRTVSDADLVLKVYGYEGAIDNVPTKVAANQIYTSSLSSFNIDGYLDGEIRDKSRASQADKENLNFINNASVVKSGSVWNFASGTYNWRCGIHHHFWAYYPSSLGLTVDNPDVTKASFSNYTNDGTKDVLVTYTNRYYGEPDESDDTRDASLSLQFHHALAEFCYKTDSSSVGVGTGASVGFFDKDGVEQEVNYEDEGSSTRVKINNVEIRKIYTKGDCSVGEDGTFTWSNLSAQSGFSKGEKDSVTGKYKPLFVIPQERSNTLVFLEATDNVRQLTIPFVFEGKDAFGTGIWQAGHRYQYHFNYTFKVPDVTDSTTGIDATFSGKWFHFKKVVDNLPGKYIAQIKITWTGVVDANPGQGTYYMMGIKADDGTTDGNFTEPSSYTAEVLKAANIGFCVNHKDHTCIIGTVGSYDPNASRDVLNAVPCSCTIDIPEGMTKFDIYALYTGGQNGDCYWHMSNMKVEVTKWR